MLNVMPLAELSATTGYAGRMGMITTIITTTTRSGGASG